MSWHLGVDLGTTFTAAAICGPDGRARMAGLGDHGTAVPSVLLLTRDGDFLVGDAAVRRATDEPDRIARESKRRVGDSVPVMLGGSPYAAALLQARLLRWVVDKVTAVQGSAPAGLAVTHPASWGPYKLEELRSAIRQVDVEVTTLLPEPVAAATAYAAERELGPGATIAVYDLGGGTFDCCIVRRDAGTGAFAVIGTPEGIDRLGGIDFDEAVFDHVRRSLGGVLDGLDPDDPATVAGLAHLRRECTAAKEALSVDTNATVSVLLPSVATTVRLSRAEFEGMIRPALSETIGALRRTVRTAGIEPDDLDAVLLVGGSSRIPQVAQLVGAELGRPVAVDAHPKDAIALGAALAVAAAAGGVAVAPHAPPVVPARAPAPEPVAPAPEPAPSEAPMAEVAPEPAVAPSPAGATSPPDRSGRRPAWLLPVVALVVVAAIVGGVLALGGGDEDSSEVDTVEIDEEEIDPQGGDGIVLRSVSVPDTAMLVIRGVAPEDVVVSVFGHEDADEALNETNDALIELDSGVVADFLGTSSATDVTDRDVVADEVEADLPPILLATSDDVSSGEEEVLFLAFLTGADVEVGFTNYAGEETTTVDARIDVIDWDLEDPEDAQAFVDAVRDDGNIAELLPELDGL